MTICIPGKLRVGARTISRTSYSKSRCAGMAAMFLEGGGKELSQGYTRWTG
jgi:hypothetical protein